MENLALLTQPAFTASEKAQKKKLRNNKMKGNRTIKAVQDSNRSNDKEFELIYKEV